MVNKLTDDIQTAVDFITTEATRELAEGYGCNPARFNMHVDFGWTGLMTLEPQAEAVWYMFCTPEGDDQFTWYQAKVEAGRLVPTLAETYPFDQAKAAMEQLEAGQVRGKVVIVPDHSAPNGKSGTTRS